MVVGAQMRDLVWKCLDFGSGEALSRLCNIATLLILAREFGVMFVGLYALAQGLIQYSYPFIDFGLRHVGARLIARYPDAGQEIVRQVQRRRSLMAVLLLPILLLYSVFAKLPLSSKLFLFGFGAIGSLYAASLDWAAWGKEHLRLASFGRAVVPISILTAVLLGRSSHHMLWWLVGGNGVGALLQVAIFRKWWRQQQFLCQQETPLELIRDSLAWRRTSIMGVAWFCNMAFNSVDMLMLGLMSNLREVGFYSVSYRILSQILFTYYLMTGVLYPQLARQNKLQRLRMLRPRILLSIAGIGIVIAGLVSLLRCPVISILFGRDFLPAAFLVMLLVWAIPLDFLTSYLTNAYIAWGMERRVLNCTAIAAGANIVLNFFSIRKYGATAAAANTLISYVIFLAALAIVGRSASQLTIDSERVPELI